MEIRLTPTITVWTLNIQKTLHKTLHNALHKTLQRHYMGHYTMAGEMIDEFRTLALPAYDGVMVCDGVM